MEVKFVTDVDISRLLSRLNSWMPFKKGNNSKTIEESGLEAINDFELAVGKYNKSDKGTIFSVGIGKSTSDRKNAIEIKDNGEVLVKKSVSDDEMVAIQDIIGATEIDPPSRIDEDFIENLAKEYDEQLN